MNNRIFTDKNFGSTFEYVDLFIIKNGGLDMNDLAVKREISPKSIIYYYISKIPRFMILMLIGSL